jgi:hypothetical protein
VNEEPEELIRYAALMHNSVMPATSTEQWETSNYKLQITNVYWFPINFTIYIGRYMPCEWRIWNDVVALSGRKWRHIYCFSPSCASAPPFHAGFSLNRSVWVISGAVDVFLLRLALGATAIKRFRLRPECEAREQRDSPTLFDPNGYFRCMNHRQSTHHSAFDKPVELHWWTCGSGIDHSTTDLHLDVFKSADFLLNSVGWVLIDYTLVALAPNSSFLKMPRLYRR